jgi:hypothetical protein
MDQPVQTLRNVFAEILPVHMRRAAGRIANDIDQKRQPAAVMSMRDVNDNCARCRVAKPVLCQDFGCDGNPVQSAGRNVMARAHGKQLQ